MTANGNATPAFRRQASTAGVNPVLTVALTPVPKVDYSVTKGGARTWIVLLVFVLLCSSLYTIFSAKDNGETHHDLSDHKSVDDDATSAYDYPGSTGENDDVDDDDDEPPPPPTQQRVSRKQEQQTAQQKTAPPAAQVLDSDDDDDEESNEHTLGGRLFAGLRKKITDRLNEKSVKEEAKTNKNDKILNPRELRKLKKQQKEEKTSVIEEQNDDDDDDDDVELPVPQKPSKKQKAHSHKEDKKERHKKYQPVKEEPDLDDDDDEDDDEDDDNDDEDDKDDDNDDDKDDDKEDDDDEDEDDDEEDNGRNKKKETVKKVEKKEQDDDNEEDDEQKISHKEAQRLRRQHLRESRRENRPRNNGKRECIHQDCPDHESLKPRKSLLVKKKKPVKSMIEKMMEDELDDDEDDDDDEDERNIDRDDDDDDDDENVDERASERDTSSSYKRHAITTKEEIGFRDILDRADHLVEKHNYEEAMDLFDHVIAVYPSSTRAYFGKARAYDIRGEIEANERDRDKAIEIYEKILQNNVVPEALFRQAAQRLIEKTRFRGMLHRTLNAHRLYIDRFPEELNLQTDFAISFVMMKRYEDARTVLRNVLAKDPNHVMALAYYGYILKAHDDKVEQGVALMRKSLKLADDEITDPKFYYQLGHGLTTLGKKSEADAVYQKAAQMGVFMTAQQRSLYNIEGLSARAWWNMDQTPYSKFLKTVERQWATIRQEGMEILRDCNDCWLDHNQQLVIDGQWKYFPIMSEQHFIKASCERMPQTCLILQEFSSSSNASKSEMYLSVLSSGASILPHCGPTNYHLQAHLGLVSPSEARIRVGNETKGWRSGKFVIFDESFEHELQFDGASSSSFRLVLVLQLWHPEVQPHQRVLSFLS